MGLTRGLRENDYASYVCQAFIPPPSRDAYIAIRAFNVEVARIADTTSTPTIGMMRMQFWRDTITKALSGNPPKEPVALLLAKATQDLHYRTDGRAKLSKGWFLRIINTREQHLDNPPYPTIAALERYAENTYSTMLYLTLAALPQTSVTTDHFASHIGKAMGITAVLRGVPLVAFPPGSAPSNHQSDSGSFTTSQGAVLLPLDIMAETNVKEEDVFRLGAEAPGLRDAVFKVATRASDHLITARDMLASLRSGGELGHEFEHQGDEGHGYSPQQQSLDAEAQKKEVEKAFGVFMPCIATQAWLDQLQGVDFDVFNPGLRKTDWRLPWKTSWSYYRRQL